MQCCNPLKQINKFYSSLLETKAEPVVVHTGHHVKVILPKNPLAAGSLIIEPNDDVFHLSAWTKAQHEQAFEFMIKIIDIWKKSNTVGDYMVYGKVTPGEKFAWEVVPYPKTNWKIVTIWNQFKVLWNITFGATVVSSSAQNKLSEFYAKNLDKFYMNIDLKSIIHPKGTDKFCEQDVINRQSVYEGKHIRILHDYAPLLGKDKTHLLLMPRYHREKFENLSKEEYGELAEKRGLLVEHYEKKGFKTIYLYSNNGSIQSQKHFHEHFIPTTSKIDEIWGKLKVLKKILLPFLTSKLNIAELAERISSTQKELTPLLK
jgi:diadenosine tetraphosphate (Ap4A) HIT family hydrolase